MKWQDAVLSVGSILLTSALLPMLFGTQKPAPSSAFLTGAVLWAFMVVYASLGLYYAMAVTALTAAGWSTLYFQARSS